MLPGRWLVTIILLEILGVLRLFRSLWIACSGEGGRSVQSIEEERSADLRVKHGSCVEQWRDWPIFALSALVGVGRVSNTMECDVATGRELAVTVLCNVKRSARLSSSPS
jgi:hypothetical protein